MAIEDHLIAGVNGIFYITIATLFCSRISLIIRYSYKSRCTEKKCCCCFYVKRYTVAENQEDSQILKPNITDKKSFENKM